jgi:hypothetical protein
MWDERTDTEPETFAKRIHRASAHHLLLKAALEQTECTHSNQVLRGRLWIDACEGNDPHVLAARKVTAVVSIGTVSVRTAWYPEHEGIRYHRILIEDDDNANMLQHLDDACRFIHQHMEAGNAVLVQRHRVHCLFDSSPSFVASSGARRCQGGTRNYLPQRGILEAAARVGAKTRYSNKGGGEKNVIRVFVYFSVYSKTPLKWRNISVGVTLLFDFK